MNTLLVTVYQCAWESISVIYANIFQENKLFAREYEDISSELPLDKQKLFFQKLKVQPLTEEETTIVNSPQFIKLKEIQTKENYQ